MFSPKSDIKPRGPLTASLVLSWNLMNPNHLKLDIISYGWATIKFVIRLPIRSWRLPSSDQNRNYNCRVKSSDIEEKNMILLCTVLFIFLYTPSKELCSKMAPGEVGVSLSNWCHTLVLPPPGYWGLCLNLIIFW